MMRRALLLLAFLGTTGPGLVAAQGSVGLGGRAGTLGLGAELAYAVTETVVLRGGIGFVPFEPTLTFSDVEAQLTLPTVYTVGLDLYVNSAMRIGGGFLFRAADPEISANFTENQEIGGSTFSPQQLGTLTGLFDQNDRAPYMLIGFGNHTATGTGLFVDFGVVFVGDPAVTLSASGGTLSDDADPLRSALDAEATEIENDLPGYLKVFPIFSLGFRLGAY